MARKRPVEKVRIVESSGNVFEDLGFPDPEEELVKAHLSSCIREVVRRRRLTQKAAAALMGIDQPKVSLIFNGHTGKFSSGRLMRLLRYLGQDVEIIVKDPARPRTRGRIRMLDQSGAPRARRRNAQGVADEPRTLAFRVTRS